MTENGFGTASAEIDGEFPPGITHVCQTSHSHRKQSIIEKLLESLYMYVFFVSHSLFINSLYTCTRATYLR
jgi:hypothetical protein